jgi:hypothetical protein
VQSGYKDEERERRESEALYRFQAEWAMKYGRKFVANNADFGMYRIREDSEAMMENHRELLKKYRKKKR